MTFNGVALFGVAVQAVTVSSAREDQRVAAPGLDGVGSLDLGFRGRVTQVSGRIYGANQAALATWEALFRSYHDGLAYVFVDQYGTAWPNCKLGPYQPAGPIQQDPTYPWTRRYTVTIEHLT